MGHSIWWQVPGTLAIYWNTSEQYFPIVFTDLKSKHDFGRPWPHDYVYEIMKIMTLLWLTIWSANPGRPGNGLHLYRLVELLSHRVAHCGAEKWQLALKLNPCSSLFMLKFGKKHCLMTTYWVYDHHKYLLRFLWLDPATASNFHTSVVATSTGRQDTVTITRQYQQKNKHPSSDFLSRITILSLQYTSFQF